MIIFTIFGTPVKIKYSVLPIPIVLWGGVTWLGLYWHPERSFWQGVLIGFVTSLFLLSVEFGHPLAHIFSARMAKAPMDEIVLAADMPRTIYWNNNVSPNAHRLRAAGGLIYNFLGILVFLGIYFIFPNKPLVREIAGWTAAAHGLLLVMSIMPVPIVDGGTILKWTLVAHGRSEEKADAVLRQLDWILGIVFALAGIGFIVARMWILGAVLIVAGAAILGVASGKIH